MKYLSNFRPKDREEVVLAILKNPDMNLFAVYPWRMPPNIDDVFSTYDYESAKGLYCVAVHDHVPKESINKFWDDWLGHISIHLKD